MGIASQGEEAIGVFPSSQSQDLKKTFLKHPIHHTVPADTQVRDIALALKKQCCNLCWLTGQEQVHTSHASCQSQDAFCRGAVAC